MISKVLQKQCDSIDLDYHEINLSYLKKPEKALLKYFEKQGYIGSFNEGFDVQILLKALMLDKLEEYNTFKCRQDACCRYLSAQFVILENHIQEIIESMKTVSSKKLELNLNEILNQPFIQDYHPNTSFEIAMSLFCLTDINIWINLAYKISENPYDYCKGWPDLIIIKDKNIEFIEVKTTDKLHTSQLNTIPILKKILPYSFSLYQVKKVLQ
jgi:hypothetical protein